MKKIFPIKLKVGDEVRIIAPSKSLAIISPEAREIANKRLAEMGLRLSFGKHVEEVDEFDSSKIESRVEDLHEAFNNPMVRAIITAKGGSNSNQILKYLNWDLIKRNPKVFCGYSDITVLNNAIYAKTGLVTYSGPSYSALGREPYIDYTLEYLKKCLFSDKTFEIVPSKNWSDQDGRGSTSNQGWLVINEGDASGAILGGHLDTFNLLKGTEYCPGLKNSILFIEVYERIPPPLFDRDLQSLIHLPEFSGVKGVVIGRFQKASEMTDEKLIKIIKTKKELTKIPIIANVDFGHTDPKITFPIGGLVQMRVKRGNLKLEIVKH